MEIPQWLVNWLLGGGSTLLGWFAKTIWDAQRTLTKEVKDLELLVVGKYVTTEAFEKRMTEFNAKLDRADQKLDRLLERLPIK